MGSLIAIPLFVTLITQILISPILKLATNSAQAGNEAVPQFPVNPSVFLFASPIFFLVFISLILLFISFKKFQFANDPLNKKAGLALTVIFLILFLPAIILVSLGYIKAMDKDYGYTNAKSQVTYHVYKPTTLPKNMVNATKFVAGEELAGKRNAVRVVYDLPIDVMMKTGQTKPIVFTQVGVESGFDLEVFAGRFLKDAAIKKVSLTNAANKTGYLLHKPLGSSALNALVYKTEDNVQLTFISPKASSIELLRLAGSLK